MSGRPKAFIHRYNVTPTNPTGWKARVTNEAGSVVYVTPHCRDAYDNARAWCERTYHFIAEVTTETEND